MPLVKVTMSVEIDDEKRQKICLGMSKICAEELGKPEQYVASIVELDGTISFAGQTGPSAFVELRSIGGLNPDTNRAMSEKICSYLQQQTGISPGRIYINFIEIKAANWGWQGRTFA